MVIRRDIDEVDYISSDEFNERYFERQRPLILRGLANRFPAGKKWTLDYLKQHCGDVEVKLFDNARGKQTTSAFTTPDLKMRFSEYLGIIERDEPSSLRMFLFNMFRQRPALRADFPCPPFFSSITGRMGYMFFGAKGTNVRVHQDIDMASVLLTQFYGRKRVVLIAPWYSDLMYRLPYNTHSLVNLGEPDLKKYPGLRYVEAQECVLGPGDSLFMPSGYWHYITYLDGGFAVSYRKLAPDLLTKLKGAVNLGLYMPFDKLMEKLRGDAWLQRKQRISALRADKIIAGRTGHFGTFTLDNSPFISPGA